VIQLTEDDVGGAFPGRPEDEARRLARRRALDALAQPIDLGSMGHEGEAAQAIGDARSSVEEPRHFAGDVGLRSEDAIPPSQGGPADMPAASSRRVVLTEEDVPPVTASLSQATSGDVRRTLSPQALTHRDAHQAADVSTPAMQASQPTAAQSASGKSAERPMSAMDRELAANREAHARRVLAGALSNVVRLVGMGATGVPVAMGEMLDVGLGAEREGEIRRQHRLAAAEKDREGREAELARARLEREQAASADEMAFRREQLDVMRQRGERGPATSPLQQAQADRIREEIARHQREMEPQSPESATARAQYLALVDTLPQGMRGRLMQAIPPERVETMSAAELRAPTARIQAFRERGTAGSSSGGGGQAAATRAALIRAYRERTGVSEEEAAAAVSALGSQRAAGALTTDALARGRAEARAQTTGEEILPGVTAGVDLSPGEARNLRDGFSIARTSLENLRAVEGVARRYGAGGVISPEARAEMRPRLITMRAMVAQMGNTGVINPTEVPTINAGLPDPTNLEQMTVGDFSAQLAAWRSQLEATIRSGLVARGVDEDGVRTAMTMLHGRRAAPRAAAGGAASAPAAGVRVRHPDGRTGTIPRAQIERAQAAGFEVVSGP
jgi:hypothetical protein